MPNVFTQKTIIECSQEEVSSVLRNLNGHVDGLSDGESKKRIQEFGPNTIVEKKELNVILEFLSHFTDPLVLILIVAAGFSVLLGEKSDAIIISGIILFGVILDFSQEYSADQALKKLTESVKTTATVIRNGVHKEVKIAEIAVGDIVFLSSGDMIPADARIIESKDFFVNQSVITGESFPCEKTPEKIEAKSTSLDTLHNIVFSGTNVVSGSAKAIVLHTGANTEFGKIAVKLARAPEKSEFEIGINHFGIFILKLTFILVIFIFFFNSIVKHDYFQSFMFAIAIAVGVTPELLPMIMSITMTAGSRKMAKKGVIVKKLSAIPNFGSMNILCTDKTGTLTENKIHLVKYTNFLGEDDESVFLFAYVNSSFQTGIKNPMDEAVISFKKTKISHYTKIDEIPYDFFRKRMSVIVRDGNDQSLITKGAPEEMFKICTWCLHHSKSVEFSGKIRDDAMKVYHAFSADGYRVLALARKKVEGDRIFTKNDETEMELMGYIAFLDPPKKDIKSVINELSDLGVEVKIITGDNELVTQKICSEVGLEVKGVLLGSNISEYTDSALLVKAQNTTIFARFSPADKSRIIRLLKGGNNIVGYMGDGINDAPSLKSADVGISVDTAVDVAKESADLVLTKKSLHNLRDGIIEGRKTFGNTMKYVMMALSSNFGNMFSAAVAIIFLPFLPMLPIQILLNNLIYDFSQITIPIDNVDSEWIQKPRRWNLAFIKKFMYVFGPISSMFDLITFGVLFFALNASASVFQTGWFMESLATQTLVIHIIRTKGIPFLQSTANVWVIVSSLVCLAIGWILPYTSVGAYFRFEPLSLRILGSLVLIVITYLLVVQVAKGMFYRKYDF
ncbi:magnesium-translocating P-type ATPase [Candidatus Peregrinibacteria bacterium]|nr:magnesium-translocating P-type ATPase [Candidatus Peregrinibacteria bacterium]